MGILGWECVSVWSGGREGAGLPHLAAPLSAQLSAPLQPGCLLWLWASSWVLELLGLEEQRVAKWDWLTASQDGKQMGSCSSWAAGITGPARPSRCPALWVDWGPRKTDRLMDVER